MALTATATRSSREIILRSVCMVEPVIISVSPHKKNIVYTVHPKPDIGEFIESIVDCLKRLREITCLGPSFSVDDTRNVPICTISLSSC